MTANANALDEWIRGRFIDLNSELEDIYWNQEDRANTVGVGDDLKQTLLSEGNELITALLAEGNTDEGFEAGFDLLGNVGFFMAACRRHELTEPTRETHSPLREASALALQVGASVGMIPRFSTAHLTTHNRAHGGVAKSFTHGKDEAVFNEFNTRAILAYQRASEALLRVSRLGMTSPVAIDLLRNAKDALDDVYASNEQLNAKLDVDRFFYSVRPYYKTYRVGHQSYRGANAGDFAGINVIDLLLGLCRGDDAYYSQLLVDKMLYMMPEDQALLRDVLRRRSLLSELKEQLGQNNQWPHQAQTIRSLLDVLDAHGRAAQQHHDLLVDKFITKPSKAMEERHHGTLTASGPPLPVLLAALEKLRDLRCARQRSDVKTAFEDVELLRGRI